MAIYRGELPRRALALTLEWAALHREELRQDWKLAKAGQLPRPIAPLDLEQADLMALLRIRQAIPLDRWKLRLTLTDDSVIERGISSLLAGAIFEPLKADEKLFKQVRVENGTVVWPNGADLCPDTVIWGGPPPEHAAHPPKELVAQR